MGTQGLLPASSVALLREFSVRNHEPRAWPSARELLSRDSLHDDTSQAADFAWWLARCRPEQFAQVLRLAPHERLPLQAYQADRSDAQPDATQALLQRVADGTRPLESEDEVRAVLARAQARAPQWPTWIEDRQQLLRVLGAHVARMPAGLHARAMEVLREANDALPAPRRIDLAAYDR